MSEKAMKKATRVETLKKQRKRVGDEFIKDGKAVRDRSKEEKARQMPQRESKEKEIMMGMWNIRSLADKEWNKETGTR